MSARHACGFDLGNADVTDQALLEDDAVLRLVGSLQEALLQGWALVPGHGRVPTLLYLTGVRQIMCLVAGKKYGTRLRAAVAERYGMENPPLELATHQAEFQYLSQADRRRVLQLVAGLLSDWP